MLPQNSVFPMRTRTVTTDTPSSGMPSSDIGTTVTEEEWASEASDAGTRFIWLRAPR